VRCRRSRPERAVHRPVNPEYRSMILNIARRLGYFVALVLLVSLGVLVLFDRLPGNTAEITLGPLATPEQLAAYEKELGLDRPLGERYVAWLEDLVTFDLGRSSLSGQK